MMNDLQERETAGNGPRKANKGTIKAKPKSRQEATGQIIVMRTLNFIMTC